jgi:phage shock protein PspC (stress-responsive transcriptional regulator)
MKKLNRSRNERIIAGVCGGIGEYFDIDPVIIRIITVLLVLFGGGGLLAYLVAIFIIPLEPSPELEEKKAETPAKELKKTDDQPLAQDKTTSLQKHVSFLGGLYIVFNSITLIIAIIVFAAVAGGGLISGDETVIAITTIIAFVVAGFLILFSAPGIICGFGLLKYRPWSRILALILGAINLINIPFGTALGIYTIWVLIQEETETLFKNNQ